MATGFDAITGALTNIDISGEEMVKLKDQWKGGAKSYLGIGITNFPNFLLSPDQEALQSYQI